jgi:spore germination protein KB
MTLIEYSEIILSFLPGKVFGFIFLFFYLHLNGTVLRIYGEFVVGSFFTKTPLIVIIGSMTLVCAFAVRGGVEVVARGAQFFSPIVVVLLLFIIILLIPDMEPKNILPIMDKGIMPSLRAAVSPQGWFSDYILIAFLLPFLSDRGNGLKWGMISVFAVILTLVAMNMVALFIFGTVTSSFTYPLMSAARYISIADFLQNLESIIMAIWVAGTFIKISVIYHALVLGTAQWLNLSDYRPLIFRSVFCWCLYSIWFAPNLQEISLWIGTAIVFYLATKQVVIKVLLLMMSKIRKKKST